MTSDAGVARSVADQQPALCVGLEPPTDLTTNDLPHMLGYTAEYFMVTMSNASV